MPSFLFDKDGIVLLYAGSLYKDIRNPLEFLKLFEKLIERKPNTYLYFVGDLKDCKDIVCEYKMKYSDNIFISGCLSREDTIMRIKGCDVLINLANLSSVQLPGKVVEYLYSGKKIINYSEKEEDNSTKFFIKYSAHGQVLNITRDNYDIEEVLNFITNVNFFENINIEAFKPKNIAKIYFKTIGKFRNKTVLLERLF